MLESYKYVFASLRENLRPLKQKIKKYYSKTFSSQEYLRKSCIHYDFLNLLIPDYSSKFFQCLYNHTLFEAKTYAARQHKAKNVVGIMKVNLILVHWDVFGQSYLNEF